MVTGMPHEKVRRMDGCSWGHGTCGVQQTAMFKLLLLLEWKMEKGNGMDIIAVQMDGGIQLVSVSGMRRDETDVTPTSTVK